MAVREMVFFWFSDSKKSAVGMGPVFSMMHPARLARAAVMLLVFLGTSTGAFSQSDVGCTEKALDPAGGLGTSSSPYQIATLCQLQGMTSASHYIQVADIDASPTRSWNVYPPGSAAKGFAPLGTSYGPTGVRTGELGFSGVFDGSGYRISNLFINRHGEDRVGLFSRLSEGTLRRVLLKDTEITGNDYVGSLVGENERGYITDSYATGGRVSGISHVGGFVGMNEYSTIQNSYATGNVKGTYKVGGFVGSVLVGSIDSCYATGGVTSGDIRIGGLVGLIKGGSISNSYATGEVTGNLYTGGLVGEIFFGSSISNSYATGKVTGSAGVGDLVGYVPSARARVVISNSYGNSAATAKGGAVGLGVSRVDIDVENSSRTLEQLRCPTGPGQACGSATGPTYSDWSESIWYFGDAEALPVIRALSAPSTPLRLRAQWLSPSTLRLIWGTPELGNVNIEYQVKALGISEKTRSTFLDVSGADLEKLRNKEGGSNFKFSVQGSNHFSEGPGPMAKTAVPLLDVPGPPGMLAVTENDLLVSVAFDPPDNDGFGRGPRDRGFREAVDDVQLQLGYLVELYRGGTSVAEQSARSTLSNTSKITIDFSKPVKRDVEYRIAVRFYNAVGDGPSAESILSSCRSESDLVPDGGSGNINSPYRIATLCQLRGMASTPHYIQVADIEASPTRNWNIYPQGTIVKGFAPIGAAYSSTGVRTGDLGFSGVFDGSGYLISNLFINRPDEDRVGLFSKLSEGTLRRVLLEDTEITGNDYVGSLVGENERGYITDSYATGGRVSGISHVGGFVGMNEYSTIRSSYATGNVKGAKEVGGFVGSVFAGSIGRSYAAGDVTGTSASTGIGGLVGRLDSGGIRNSYATGKVTGVSWVGGLVGEAYNGGSIRNSYATGKVTGASGDGGLVGYVRFGTLVIRKSYGNSTATAEGGLVGDGVSEVVIDENSSRTLVQLRCPTEPGEVCGSPPVQTYSGWSTRIWYFGDSETLPVIRSSLVPSTPLQLEAKWLSPSTLRLTWDAPELGNVNIEYQVKALGISKKTRSTFIDVSGADLQKLREGKGGSNFEFTVQGSNHFGGGEPGPSAITEVFLLNVPGPSAMLAVTEDNLRVSVAFGPPNNDGFGRGPRDPDFGKAVDGIGLQPGYLVELYRGGTSVAEQSARSTLSDTSKITIDFSKPIKRDVEYRIAVRFYNAVGNGPSAESILSSCRSESDLVPDGGSGTSRSPYRIATLCQLRGMASTPHYIQVVDIEASPTRSWNIYPQGTTVKGFAPIGATYSFVGVRTGDLGFSGVFDGGGYRISNLFINRPDEDRVGLFSRTLAGTLRRVLLEDTQTTGKDYVGSLVGESGYGLVTDSYAIRGKVSGEDYIGGLVGLNRVGSVRNSHADMVVVGTLNVGGLVAWSETDLQNTDCPVLYSYATGSVTGRGVNIFGFHTNVGGLIGALSKCSVKNSYATGAVRGLTVIGGLVGSNSGGSVSNSYATGKVRGATDAGGLVGSLSNSGRIRNSYATGEVAGADGGAGGLVGVSNSGMSISNSYATGKVRGTSRVGDLVGYVRVGSIVIHNSYSNSTATITGGAVGGDRFNTRADKFSRTLAQLRCPTGLEQACGSPPVQTYLDWSESVWYFGDAQTLPVIIRTLPAPGTPLRLEAQWPTPSTLRLLWDAPRFGSVNVEYQVRVGVPGIFEKTRSTFLDVSGADLEQLRKKEGGSSFEFSVQGSNHFGEVTGPTAMTEVPLLNVPGPPTSLGAVATEVAEGKLRASVAFGPTDNDGLGRDSGNPDFGKATGGLELRLAYFVEIYADRTMSDTRRIVLQASDASTTISFSGLAPNLDYRVVVRAENVVGFSSPVGRLFGSSPSITISGVQVESVIYGASSARFTLQASASHASSLRWSLSTVPERDNSTVYFTTDTGSEAVVVYESLDEFGIVLSDRFRVQVMGPTGFDTIEVNVVTASATPVIVQGELTTARISRGVVSTEVALNTRNIHEDLTWSWVDSQSMTTARFRAQDGVEAEMGESSQKMTVVLHVPEEFNEASFTIEVIEAGDSELRDEIVIRVVRQRMAGARLRFRIFLGGAVR